MVNRMVRAVQADVALYEEAEHSPSLTQEAYTIVGIVAAINAVVALLYGIVTGDFGGAILSAIFAAIVAFGGYLLWAYLSYYIGTNFFDGTADVGELQRTLGYAWTPQILVAALGLIPFLGACLGLIPAIWSIYLGIVAIRQALDVDTTKAVLTAVVAFVVQLVIFAIIGGIIGVGAAGYGFATGAFD